MHARQSAGDVGGHRGLRRIQRLDTLVQVGDGADDGFLVGLEQPRHRLCGKLFLKEGEGDVHVHQAAAALLLARKHLRKPYHRAHECQPNRRAAHGSSRLREFGQEEVQMPLLDRRRLHRNGTTSALGTHRERDTKAVRQALSITWEARLIGAH